MTDYDQQMPAAIEAAKASPPASFVGPPGPWTLLPPVGAPNPRRRNMPYVVSQRARWAMSAIQLEVQNRPEVKLLKRMAAKEFWDDPANRKMMLEAIREALKRPEVVQRRDAAIERLMRMPPKDRALIEKRTREKVIAWGPPPCADDRDGDVYVAHEVGSPEGPFKVGSSFEAEMRIRDLERDGYYEFFDAGCQLTTALVRRTHYFRQVEIRTHEILKMRTEEHRKAGLREMCFGNLLEIERAIDLAEAQIEAEMKAKEDARAAALRRVATHPPRVANLMLQSEYWADSGPPWEDTFTYESDAELLLRLHAAWQAVDRTQQAIAYIFHKDINRPAEDFLSPLETEFRNAFHRFVRDALLADPDSILIDHSDASARRIKPIARAECFIVRRALRALSGAVIVPPEIAKRMRKFAKHIVTPAAVHSLSELLIYQIRARQQQEKQQLEFGEAPLSPQEMLDIAERRVRLQLEAPPPAEAVN